MNLILAITLFGIGYILGMGVGYLLGVIDNRRGP